MLEQTLRYAICCAIWMSAWSPFVVAQQAPSTSVADQKVRVEVPAAPVASALQELARQTGLNVVFHSEVGQGLTSNRLAGTFTRAQAFGELLAGTPLRYEFVDRDTVGIRLAADAVSNEAASNKAPAQERPRAEPERVESGSREPATDRAAPGEQKAGEAARVERQTVEEVIVTAQKREERLRDVPMSIVAMNADELRNRRVTSVDDLAMIVPGISAQSNGGYSRQINLRGIGNPVGTSSLIGLYLDEAAVTGGLISQLDLKTYDLERVEVLRGPQGTLYGDGSAGGTIRFLTRDPVLDSFGLSANLAALSIQDGDTGGRAEAMLNMPLVERQLGLRIAGIYEYQGGWIDQPAAGVKDFNGLNLADVRVKTLWRPVDPFSANFMAVIHRNNAAFNNGEDDSGNYVQNFDLTTTPAVEDDYDLYNLTLNYDLAAARLLSTTSYIDHAIEVRNLGGKSQRSAPPALAFSTYTPSDIRKRHGVTQELRLTSTGPAPWQWTFGGYYRRQSFSEDIPQRYSALAGPPGTPLPPSFPPFHQDTLSESWAAFGDSSYTLTDRLTLGAGLRYFQEDQEFNDGGVLQSGEFHSTSPRVYAQYKLTSAINLYASAAKGFRSGGFNVAGQPPYGPEEVRTYELGSKMVLPGAGLSLDAALFYSDYRNYQIFGNLLPPSPPLAYFSNAGSARIEGVEWGLTWRPAEHWELGLNGDYVSSEFYEINVSRSAYDVGDQVDMIPKYQYTVALQRDFGWYGKAGFARLDYSEQGRQVFRNRRTGPWYYSESDIINLLSFNFGLQWSERVSLRLFASNLLNDRGYTNPLILTGAAARSRPRTYGIEFGVAF